MMSDNFTKLTRTVIRRVLPVLAMMYLAPAMANECLDLFPYDVTADGLPKICQSNFSGKQASYSCQDYRSGKSRYRVLYKGGRTAKAVLALYPNGTQTVLSTPLHGDPTLDCPLKSPVGVPKYAMHRGMGVCHDDDNLPIVCSIYQHAAARQPIAHLYMVYYPNDKHHKLHIDVENAGANEDAMVAEIAYQIGRSLLKTSCCSDRAMQYLAFAYRLFPRSEVYRHAYQRSRAILAFGNL